MSMAAASIDPLAHFFEAIFRRDDRKPVPLTSTQIDVTIRGGLASVTTQRTFRNTETKSIEATMTFPVPVDATLCALTANIDGRVLHAVARAREKASKAYEAAVKSGKSAILHQELLKGIHMLCVGHVRPGGEIVVTDTWTAPLSFLDETPRLRIPTTVGEIYGRSPLAPPDDLVTGGIVHEATVAIACSDGTASLLQAGRMIEGRYHVTLDAPIDIVITGWTQRKLTGVAADGRQVVLDIAPAPADRREPRYRRPVRSFGLDERRRGQLLRTRGQQVRSRQIRAHRRHPPSPQGGGSNAALAVRRPGGLPGRSNRTGLRGARRKHRGPAWRHRNRRRVQCGPRLGEAHRKGQERRHCDRRIELGVRAGKACTGRYARDRSIDRRRCERSRDRSSRGLNGWPGFHHGRLRCGRRDCRRARRGTNAATATRNHSGQAEKH